MRSFVWWTAPLYVVFLVAGLYAVDFALTPALEVLVGVLIAFGILDALVLVRIASIQARPIETLADLETSRRQIERLSRTLVLGGTAFGAAFVLAVVVLAFF